MMAGGKFSTRNMKLFRVKRKGCVPPGCTQKTLSDKDTVLLLGKTTDQKTCLAVFLRRPKINYAALMRFRNGVYAPHQPLSADKTLLRQIEEQVEISIKYQGYIDRQMAEIERCKAYENMRLPENIDYGKVRGLSFEVSEKLTQYRPQTL